MQESRICVKTIAFAISRALKCLYKLWGGGIKRRMTSYTVIQVARMEVGPPNSVEGPDVSKDTRREAGEQPINS